MIKINIIKKLIAKFIESPKEDTDIGIEAKPDLQQKNTRKKFSEQQKFSNELMSTLKSEYEKASKLASGNPILDQCTIFYNQNFNPKERAIGITFIKDKLIPRAVPIVKQAINTMVLEHGITLESLESEENISKLLELKMKNRPITIKHY